MDADAVLYLTITRGAEPRPLLATSDPVVIKAVARALNEVLVGPERPQMLRLARELDVKNPEPAA
jgi:hypothetical protein